MKINFCKTLYALVITLVVSCSTTKIALDNENLGLVNRVVTSSSIDSEGILKLSREQGDGLAIIKNKEFDTGTIELELKGEDNPGKSFVGVAFNIQNDTTYEAIYFRPFNFKSDDGEKRAHSIQYINHPKNTWKFLRTNYKGIYEAEYPNPPAPDEWFSILVKIDNDNVYVLDKETNTQLLIIKRLEKQKSPKISLWTGNYSKGEFRNLSIQ